MTRPPAALTMAMSVAEMGRCFSVALHAAIHMIVLWVLRATGVITLMAITKALGYFQLSPSPLFLCWVTLTAGLTPPPLVGGTALHPAPKVALCHFPLWTLQRTTSLPHSLRWVTMCLSPHCTFLLLAVPTQPSPSASTVDPRAWVQCMGTSTSEQGRSCLLGRKAVSGFTDPKTTHNVCLFQ